MQTEAPLSPAKTLARERVKGLWIAIPTPFSEDGARVDEDRLAADVDFYIDSLEVDGIFCGGVMGEFWALTLDERKRVHAAVKSASNGRVPVMAQVGDHTFADTLALCEHAREHGIEFGIAMNPYYPPNPPDHLIRSWYERLNEATDLPMFLFNTPYSGYAMSPELISELADIDNVCGIKNPQGTKHLLDVQALAGDRIVVADAAERHWLDLHATHGFQALMSTPALALYQRPGHLPIVDYTRAADDGDLDTARAIDATLAGARDAFDRWMRAPWLKGRTIPIAYLKEWLTLLGRPQGPVRPPLVPLSPDERGALRSDLQALRLLD